MPPMRRSPVSLCLACETQRAPSLVRLYLALRNQLPRIPVQFGPMLSLVQYGLLKALSLPNPSCLPTIGGISKASSSSPRPGRLRPCAVRNSEKGPSLTVSQGSPSRASVRSMSASMSRSFCFSVLGAAFSRASNRTRCAKSARTFSASSGLTASTVLRATLRRPLRYQRSNALCVTVFAFGKVVTPIGGLIT